MHRISAETRRDEWTKGLDAYKTRLQESKARPQFCDWFINNYVASVTESVTEQQIDSFLVAALFIIQQLHGLPADALPTFEKICKTTITSGSFSEQISPLLDDLEKTNWLT